MNTEQEIIADKELRRDIDVQLQKLKALPPTEERRIARDKLSEAIMWLGLDLKRINEQTPGASPNPYPESKNPASLKIEPTADGLKL